MNLGKHCFCEKPLTHEVYEARQMRLVAEKQGVVTQMGNQIHSSLEYRSAVVLVQEGAIGKIKEIHAWSGAKFPQRGRPEGEDPIPKTLDWQKWLGVAPERPFKTGIYHPFNWRAWIDFGGGAIGDFGCHILDTPSKALGLTAPTSIIAEVPKDWADNPKWNTENWPDWEIFKYVFPGTDIHRRKHYRSHLVRRRKTTPRSNCSPSKTKSASIPGGGSLFVGETGTLLLPHVGGPQLVPYSKNKDLKRPKLEPGQPLPQLRRRLPRQRASLLELQLRRPAHRGRPPRKHRQPLPRPNPELEHRSPRNHWKQRGHRPPSPHLPRRMGSQKPLVLNISPPHPQCTTAPSETPASKSVKSASAPGPSVPIGARSLQRRTPSPRSTPPFDSGVNFVDTADVYGAGRSEELIGEAIKDTETRIVRSPPKWDASANGQTPPIAIEKAAEASCRRLRVDCLDLVQLHCIPTGTLKAGRAFDPPRRPQRKRPHQTLRRQRRDHRRGLFCIRESGAAALQVIFNIFRQRVITDLLPEAEEANVGIIARVPLASGLLTGKYETGHRFNDSDHRNYNADGQCFNVGETFAGVPFKTGVTLAQNVGAILDADPAPGNRAQKALRWILDHPAVSTVIPGAKSAAQAQENAAAAALPRLTQETHAALRSLYEEEIDHTVRGAY